MEKVKDILNQLEEKHQINIIYAVEAGSRAWGIESEDSDYDIRFIFIYKDHKKYISLKQTKDVIDGFSEDRIYDWQGFDITKALRLLSQMNPSVTEWVYSPIVYKNVQDYNFNIHASKLLIEQNRIFPLLYHYRSMAKSNFKAHIDKKENVKIKKYLYVIRPAGMVEWLLKCRKMSTNKLVEIDFNLVLNDLKPHLKTDIYENIIEIIRKKKTIKELDEEPRIKCIDDWIDYILNETEQDILNEKNNNSNVDDKNDQTLDEYDSVLHSFLNLKF